MYFCSCKSQLKLLLIDFSLTSHFDDVAMP